MYQVIARKYRPQTFQDVVNQEHVKTTLENAIAQGRIAHGYIFSGQRGTGKTTVARIVARCLNCVNGPTTQPCGVCSNCLEAAGGGGLNVIEIDAASNRGINEMRELNQSVRQRPASARYKVFIIDEAHQITTDAFNALLKTIEEPPEWVIFMLCTTEQHKIPPTIASRCQHFSFRSVEFEALIARMEWICKQEGIDADQEALAVLAQAGEGSVRDSLSALDQAIACCGSKLNAAEVRALLGAFSLESLDTVTQALAANDSRRMLEVVDELERNGHNLQHFSRELARYFRNLLVTRIAGGDGPLAARLVPASAQQREKLAKIAAQFSEEDLTRYLQLSLDLFKDLQFSLQPRFHLEIGLVRLVQAGRLLPIEQALAEMQGGSGSNPAPRPAPQSPPPAKTGPTPFELDRARKAAMRPAEPQGAAADPQPPVSNPQPPVLGAFELDRARKAAMRPAEPPGAAADPQPPVSNPQPPVFADPQPPIPNPQPPVLGDWREKLHAALMELGMPYTADAVENSRVAEVAGELQITTSKAYKLALGEDDLRKALSRVSPRALRIQVIVGDVESASAPLPAPAAGKEDEATRRALANPEVRRFQELFDGKIYKVRNLKES